MSASQPDYYARLGVPPSATPDQLKKRYRELARKYHPDVNPNPDAAQKIQLINEAYHILGDADRRAVYDAERLLKRQAPQEKPKQTNTGSSTSRRPESAPRPRPQEADFNGFGRTNVRRPQPDPSARPQKPAEKSTASAKRGTGGLSGIERLIAEAQLAYINRQYREAEALCRQALATYKRGVTVNETMQLGIVHEILGDISMKRGQQEAAISAYSYAVQYNPSNFGAQSKLERLTGSQGASRYAGPTMARKPGFASIFRSPGGQARETGLLAVNIFSIVLFCLTLGLFLINQGAPWLFGFSLNLIVTLMVLGMLAGMLLAFNGGMRPITEELMSSEIRPGGKPAPPLGTILALFAVGWFYASLLVYLGIGVARNRLSPSVLRVYGVVVVMVMLFAALYRPVELGQYSRESSQYIWVFALGGNLLFPSALFGWAIGDAVRLRR